MKPLSSFAVHFFRYLFKIRSSAAMASLKASPCLPKIFSIVLLPVLLIDSFSVLAKDEPNVILSLLAETGATGDRSTLLMGIRAQLKPGWKTYWRSPGGTGYSPQIDWSDSRNIKSVKILWPVPHRVVTPMGTVNAYKGDVILPLSVEINDSRLPVEVQMNVDMLVCDEVTCLPVTQTLTLTLPVGSYRKSADAPLLEAAMKNVPQQGQGKKIKAGGLLLKGIEIVGVDEIPPTLQVTFTRKTGVLSPHQLPEVFIELKDAFVDSPVVSLSNDKKTLVYSALVYPDSNKVPTRMPELAGKPAILTIDYNRDKIETECTVNVSQPSARVWAGMILVAFLGGLILNIMPCVLPVLSLKILSVLRHGGGHYVTVRQEFMATVSGIVFSFICLAAGIILLKSSGHAIGWGVQFQEPYFLIGLITILTLFACNLLGYFDFRLPTFLSSAGGFSPHRESLLGSFLEGSLVTVLATPCTAPFVGTALAFALSRGNFEIGSIFLAMGIGLSFPFILISFFPGLATRLPKPGRWMGTVQKGLGFLILATVLWLTYVLAAELGLMNALCLACLMVIISGVLRSVRLKSAGIKTAAWGATTLLIVAGFLIPDNFTRSKTGVSSNASSLWQPFDPDRVEEYVKAGKTVFVTVTADWCLTCQANKYFILNNRDVVKELENNNVVAMEADWTTHDPKITNYLKSFNQYGIPFYAVYGCRTPLGSFLGQLLTSGKVLQKLRSEKCPKKEKNLSNRPAMAISTQSDVNLVHRISSCKIP
jgi:suppressor for copper-sensitivity B